MSDTVPSSPHPAGGGDPAEVAALRHRVAELELLITRAGLPLPPGAPIAPPIAPVPPHPPGAPHTPVLTGSEERIAGMVLAAAVGGLAVIGALVIFIRHAIEHDWFGRLSPEAKFSIGIVVSVLFIVGAEVVRRVWTRDAAIALYGAGVAALFATIGGGMWALELFDATTGSLLALAATVVGALLAARSRSIIVALLGIAGGYAVPMAAGTLLEPGLAGGLVLTALLVIVLAMVACGPPVFAWLRFVALACATVFGVIWGVHSTLPEVWLGFIALAWWGLATVSCVTEALRGRSPRLNSAALQAASVLGVLGACIPTMFPQTWSNPLAYLPLGIVLVLVVLAVQFRDAAEFVAHGEPRESEMPDGLAHDALVALGHLARGATAAAPVVLLVALVALPGVAISAIGAAAVVCVLALARPVFGGGWVVWPGIAIGALVAFGASFASLVTDTPAWQWQWPAAAASANPSVRDSMHIGVGSHQISALCALALLVAPLCRARTVDPFAVTASVAATLVFVCLVVEACGQWTGIALIATVVCALAAFSARARMWWVHACVLLALASMVWFGISMPGMLPDSSITSTDDGARLPVPATATLAMLCLAAWALSALAPPIARAAHHAAALLLGVFGATFVVALQAHAADTTGMGMLALCSAVLALGSIPIIVLARIMPAPVLLAAAFMPAVLAAALTFLLGALAAFEGVSDLNLANPFVPSAIAAVMPLVAVGVLRLLLYTPMRQTPGVAWNAAIWGAVILALSWATSIVCATAACGGAPAPWFVIAATACAAGVGLYAGFRRHLSAMRWCGIALLAVLALRMSLVDFNDMPTLARVAVLFVTGIALVMVSIAYTLMPKPAAHSQLPAG